MSDNQIIKSTPMDSLYEFLDSNTFKSYPFEIDTMVPPSFLVDAKFAVTGNVHALYINKIVISNSHIQLYAAYMNENDDFIELGLLQNIATSELHHTTHACNLVNNVEKVIIEGTVTIGSFYDILQAGNNTYDLREAGKVFSSCIIPLSNWCTGLIVDDVLYTGNVTLEFGEGLTTHIEEVEEEVEDGETEIRTVITVDTAIDVPSYLTDDEIIDQFESGLSQGVTSLNGLTGDVTINAGSAGGSIGNKVSISTSGKAVVITNEVDTPSDPGNGDVEGLGNILAKIETLLANATSLNDRTAILELHIRAFEQAIAILNAQLART